MILGTISAVDNTDGLQLIIDGEDVATTKKYTYMASYVPAANDRVLIEEVGGSYVIMGKVISDVASSGIARSAQTAVNATNAENATNAINATTAASCSGNAATATTADKTRGFANSVDSESGKLVTYVTREYDYTLSKYIVTDVQTTSINRNFTYK